MRAKNIAVTASVDCIKTTTKFAIVQMAVLALLMSFALCGLGTGYALADDGETSAWGVQMLLPDDELAADPVELNVLNIAGAKGDKVYLTVMDGTRTMAKNLGHTLGEGVDEGSNAIDLFSIEVPKGDLEGKLTEESYKITVYADHAGQTELFSGKVYGVWARVDGGSFLIGAHTVGDGNAFTFTAPGVVSHNGKSYALTSATPDRDGNKLYYNYKSYKPGESADAVISYVDKDGKVLDTVTIAGVPKGGTKTYDIPGILEVDGNMYRPMSYTGSVTAINPDEMAFTVTCALMSDADKTAAGFYLATFEMVDQDGNLIAKDAVQVNGEFAYEVPSTIYKDEEVDGRMRAVAYELVGDSLYELSASKDAQYVVNGERIITVPYKRAGLDVASVKVTFNLVDGQQNPDLSGRLLGVKTATVDEENPTAEPDESIEYDGVKYLVTGSTSDYAYTFGSDEIPVINVYYVPEGYTDPQPYTVTVDYVNYADSEVVKSETYESNAENRVIELESPESFEQDGTTYLRLDGQEEPIEHDFYSNVKLYTVYYRDKDDETAASTVITRTRVVYEGTARTVTTVAGGGAGAAGTAGTVGINQQRTYTTADGNGNGTIRNEGGVDTTTERIENNDNPLAKGTDGQTGTDGSQQDKAGGFPFWAIPAAIAVLAALAAALLIGPGRKKKNR